MVFSYRLSVILYVGVDSVYFIKICSEQSETWKCRCGIVMFLHHPNL